MESPNSWSRISLIIGIVFLFIMALFWAVDDAIVYISAGAGGFFLFLAYYRRPEASASGWKFREESGRNQSYRRQGPNRQTYSDTGPDVLARLREMLRSFTANGGNKLNIVKVVRGCFLTAVLGTFAVIVLSIVFASDDNLTQLYLAEGQGQLGRGEIDSARLTYARAYHDDPENMDAAVGYGKALLASENPDSASLLFDKVLEVDPQNKEAVYNQAFIYYGQGKYTEGRNLLAPMVANNKDYYDALLLMGDFYYVEKRYDESFPWYETAYKEGNARGGLLCQRLGYLYELRQDNQQAVSHYQESLAYDSTAVGIYQRLGELMPGEDGNYYRAKAKELNP
jgi:tetratricopeptide (TPR) repeat protein